VNYSKIPGAAAALPVTSGLVVAYKYLWLGIAIIVIGGALITAAKFFPRIAIEPVLKDGRHRLAVTVNGRPLRQKPSPNVPSIVIPQQRTSTEDTTVLYRIN
jgi:hypothetical protein